MTVFVRSVILFYWNRGTKVCKNRFFLRTFRGSRMKVPSKILKNSVKVLDNTPYDDHIKSTKMDGLSQKDDYLKKYEIGTEINSFCQKRKSKDIVKESSKTNASRSLISTAENQYDLLSEIINPLYKIPYENQLQLKYTYYYNLVKAIGKDLKAKAHVHIGVDSLPCPVALTVPSPVIESYRNKDEFSIRHGVDGNPKTVGFFLDSPSEFPDTQCVNVDKIVIVKEKHKHLAKDFENYIRQSPLPPLIDSPTEGYWKNILVRSNNQNDLMVTVRMHPQNLSLEQLEDEKWKLKEYFTSEGRKNYNLKSLYFQTCHHTEYTHVTSSLQFLIGEPYFYESLNGFKFKISPETYFPINIAATECLMKSISNLCKFNSSTVLLDLFCGSGCTSICFSQYVKKCIGIDISSQAIEDAKTNAKMNNVENAEFYCGNIRTLVPDLLEDVFAEDLIAIVNSRRQELSKSDVHLLRQLKHLKKVLFISHEPKTAIHSYVELCRPNIKGMNVGKRFQPMMAVPVDMFPQTKFCELVILFQRL